MHFLVATVIKAVYGGGNILFTTLETFIFVTVMIPWLMTWEYFSRKATKLSDFFRQKNCFPSSGEINFSVSTTEKALKSKTHFQLMQI